MAFSHGWWWLEAGLGLSQFLMDCSTQCVFTKLPRGLVWLRFGHFHMVAFSHGGWQETGVAARVILPPILRFLKFVSPLFSRTRILYPSMIFNQWPKRS